jgi:hypothetical protein
MSIPSVDIEMLRRNLRLSVEERLKQHQAALDLCMRLRQAKKVKHEKRSESAS